MDFPTLASRAAEFDQLSENDDTNVQEKTTALFTELLASDTGHDTEDLAVVARFIQGNVFPGWNQTELDVGPKFLYEAIARCAGENVTSADVEEKVGFIGEIGDVAASYDFGGQQNLMAFSNTAEDSLRVTEIARELERLAETQGSGSHKQKVDMLFGLLNRCSPQEAKYLSRLVLGEMNLGVTDDTVRKSLADVLDVSLESIEIGLQVSNDYHEVIETAQSDGQSGLETMTLELGRPIQPMLAEPGTIRDSIRDWEQVAVEIKHDGARAQVHYDGEDTVRIFSRNMDDVTSALPDVVQYVKKNVDVPVILDGEIVALDADGNTRPFQNVLRRFRQQENVQALRNKVPVTYFPFDCLYHDGDELLGDPLTQRYEELWKVYPHEYVSKQRKYSSTDGVAEFESDALEDDYEGIMVKNAESMYKPGQRGPDWRKIKPDVETVEVAITGAEWSEDRRSKVMTSFLVGVRTERGFKTVGKVERGISDNDMEMLTEKLKPYIRSETGKAIDIQPAVAMEVGYEEIQESPKYTSQYALRYPRYIGLREDKDVDTVDSLDRVKKLAKLHAEGKPTEDVDDDEGNSRESVHVGSTDSESVEIVEMGDEDVNVVERDESEAQEQEEDEDDDDDSTDQIYTG